jgi:hypothetical protein
MLGEAKHLDICVTINAEILRCAQDGRGKFLWNLKIVSPLLARLSVK